jgi:hypothetical protein
MPESTQQCRTAVRTLLGRPSESKLPEDDITGVLMRLLRGYCQDLSLNHRDRKTVKEEVDIDEDDVDFIISLPTISDYEAEKLEFQLANQEISVTAEARLIPYSAWSSQFDGSTIVASLYGEDKIAINLTPEMVAARRWFLSYRPALIDLIQSNAPIPLPSDFTAMLQMEAAILCVPLVGDDSDKWIGWCDRSLPIYRSECLRWNNPDDPSRPGRWQHYLISSIESQVQPVRRSDRHRGRVRRSVPFIPSQ